MENQKTESLRPLKISIETLPASMDRQEKLTSYAGQRAELLLGCYRTGDANDPEIYVAAITAILSRYPEQVITSVTHPATGLPSKKGWLPTITGSYGKPATKRLEPIVQNERRLQRIKEQMEARERQDRGEKPTIEQLHKKYGDNWGLDRQEKQKTPDMKSDENRMAMEREQARVRAEYEHIGMVPPSKFALSPTALRTTWPIARKPGKQL